VPPIWGLSAMIPGMRLPERITPASSAEPKCGRLLWPVEQSYIENSIARLRFVGLLSLSYLLCMMGNPVDGGLRNLPALRRGQHVLAQFALSYRETIQSWSLLLSLHSALDLDWRLHV
jgi:hypothetical protein